jgi:alkyl sulfatase BDS1-like metallo-beta-lactamase superfamily hydrolase
VKIYLAGKITGLDPKEAERLFAEAEAAITKAGHTPLNPLALVDQTPGRTYDEYLGDALAIMTRDSEALFMLDNWPESNGARIEFYTAKSYPKPIYYTIDTLPIGSDWPEQDEA